VPIAVQCSLTNVFYVEFDLKEAKMAKTVLKARSRAKPFQLAPIGKIGRLEPEFLMDKKLQITLMTLYL
jgi:hypothetical protein